MKKIIVLILSLLIFNISAVVMAVERTDEAGFPDKINNIVVFIRFSDEDEFITEEKSEMIEKTYNEFMDNNNDKISDKGSISLRSYINDLTYGKTIVDTNFYPYNKGLNQYISLVTEKDKNYYSKMIIGGKDEQKVIEWAFNSIKNEIDLSPDEIDSDGDGEIDNITFIFNGEVNNVDSMFWPHKATFTGNAELKGKKLRTYNILGTGNYYSNIFNKGLLHIIIHEFLHSYNFPDLYRLYGNSKPVGIWDIMSESINPGQMPLVYTREHYGNLDINIGEIKESGRYELKKASSNDINDKIAYIVKSPLSDKEYFMIEYRKAEGNWDSSLPGSGLLVYRINEEVNDFIGNIYGDPDHIYIFRPEAIDGASALGYINGALLSKDIGRDKIGASNSKLQFDQNTIYFKDGSNSGIVIYNIGSSEGDTISFDIKLPNLNEYGSKENPYEIYNIEDLKNISNDLDKHYILMQDIDLLNERWIPIGLENDFESYNIFNGSFNGNGHTISNIMFYTNNAKILGGLFSAIGENGEIYNLNIKNAIINSKEIYGVIAVENNGKIINVNIDGDIKIINNKIDNVQNIEVDNNKLIKYKNSVNDLELYGEVYESPQNSIEQNNVESVDTLPVTGEIGNEGLRVLPISLIVSGLIYLLKQNKPKYNI